MAKVRTHEKGNPYQHPLRGIGMAFGTVFLFMLFLVGLTALVWWIS